MEASRTARCLANFGTNPNLRSKLSAQRGDPVWAASSGKAKLSVESDSMSVGPGSTVYVRAHTDHRFYDIEEELKVLVFFSTAQPSEG